MIEAGLIEELTAINDERLRSLVFGLDVEIARWDRIRGALQFDALPARRVEVARMRAYRDVAVLVLETRGGCA